jgi:hypothetical protein
MGKGEPGAAAAATAKRDRVADSATVGALEAIEVNRHRDIFGWSESEGFQCAPSYGTFHDLTESLYTV